MNIVSKITDKGMYLRQRMYIKKKTKELDFLIKTERLRIESIFSVLLPTVILEIKPSCIVG